MKYVHLAFNTEESSSRRESVWDVYSDQVEYLGKLKWLSGMKEFCFMPGCATLLTADVMRDISEKIEQLMTARMNEDVRETSV